MDESYISVKLKKSPWQRPGWKWVCRSRTRASLGRLWAVWWLAERRTGIWGWAGDPRAQVSPSPRWNMPLPGIPPAFFPLELNSVLFPAPGEIAWEVEGVRKCLPEIISLKKSYDSRLSHRPLQGCMRSLLWCRSSVPGSLDWNFPKGRGDLVIPSTHIYWAPTMFQSLF